MSTTEIESLLEQLAAVQAENDYLRMVLEDNGMDFSLPDEPLFETE